MPTPSPRETRYTFDAQGLPAPDPWRVLGLEPGADAAAIGVRYRELVRAHPPERDPEGFQRVSAAYRRLTEPDELLLRHFGEVRSLPSEELLPTEDEAGPRAEPRRFEDELFVYALTRLLPFE